MICQHDIFHDVKRLLTSSMTFMKSAFVIVENERLNASNALNRARRGSQPSMLRSLSKIFGSIETVVVSRWPGVLREMMRVGNLVHTLLATGNGMSVRLWRSDDFPAD